MQAPTPQPPKPPVDPNTMMPPSAVANQLRPAAPSGQNNGVFENQMLNYEQKSLELLGEIAGNQEMILKEMRARNRMEKVRFWVGVGKSVIIGLIVALSLWLSFKMINDMMSNLNGLTGGLMGGGGFDMESLINPTTTSRPGPAPSPSGSNQVDVEAMLNNPEVKGLLNNFFK